MLKNLSELEDEISAINIDFNHNNTLLEEENKKLAPLRDKKMESAASLQKIKFRYDKSCRRRSKSKIFTGKT